MKIFLGCLIFLIIFLIGYKFSLKYSYRNDFFIDFYNFNEILINEISYSKKNLINIIKSNVYKSKFNILINSYLNEDKIIYKDLELKPDEIEFIKNYLSILGKSDSQSQLLFLNNAKINIKKYNDLCNLEFKKNSKLIIKISIMLGLLAFILII